MKPLWNEKYPESKQSGYEIKILYDKDDQFEKNYYWVITFSFDCEKNKTRDFHEELREEFREDFCEDFCEKFHGSYIVKSGREFTLEQAFKMVYYEYNKLFEYMNI